MFKLLISIVIFIASPAVLAWNTIVIKGLPSSARVVALFKVDTGASYIAKAIQNCKVSPEQNVTCITQGGGELKFKINNDGDYALFYIFKINLSSKGAVIQCSGQWVDPGAGGSKFKGVSCSSLFGIDAPGSDSNKDYHSISGNTFTICSKKDCSK